MPLLETDKLGVRLGNRAVLIDVSLTVTGGELIAVVGPNGAGKSTLLRACAGLIKTHHGTIRLGDGVMAPIPAQTRARQIAYLPQRARCHWPLPVRKVVELGRFPYRRSWQRLTPHDQKAIDRAMTMMGVAEFARQPITTLSGGEKMRVHVARLLAGEQDLILADEPTASLDPYFQLQIIAAFKHISANGRGVVIAMHDLALASRYSDRIVVLDRGRIVGVGRPHEVLIPPLLRDVFRVEMTAAQVGEEVHLIPTAPLG